MFHAMDKITKWCGPDRTTVEEAQKDVEAYDRLHPSNGIGAIVVPVRSESKLGSWVVCPGREIGIIVHRIDEEVMVGDERVAVYKATGECVVLKKAEVSGLTDRERETLNESDMSDLKDIEVSMAPNKYRYQAARYQRIDAMEKIRKIQAARHEVYSDLRTWVDKCMDHESWKLPFHACGANIIDLAARLQKLRDEHLGLNRVEQRLSSYMRKCEKELVNSGFTYHVVCTYREDGERYVDEVEAISAEAAFDQAQTNAIVNNTRPVPSPDVILRLGRAYKWDFSEPELAKFARFALDHAATYKVVEAGTENSATLKLVE
jgi:hypothetical protein